jgi:peptidyl-prolyl cis-trans isomerase A (cyclophilin A)
MNIRALMLISAVVIVSSCSTKTREDGKPQVVQAASIQAQEMKTGMFALTDPAKAVETAPETFKVKFSTTKGDFTLEIHRAWSPLGADRFYNLVKAGFFSDTAFFRVIEGFMVQFGIHGNPDVSAVWRAAGIKDDPVLESNKRGYVSFAMAGPNTRTTQLFINFVDNTSLDKMGFSPIGRVIDGMAVVESIYSGYGEGAPDGKGPDQGLLQVNGNKYLKAEFPKLDYIKNAELLNPSSP